MKKIFSEFYSKQKDDVLLIEEAILDSREKNIYRNDMFCPECRQAQLTLVARTSNHRAYLKRIPSSVHRQECSYNYEYATKGAINNYVNTLTDKELQDKLDAIMRLLCKPKLIHDYFMSIDAHGNNIKESPMVITSNNGSLKALKRKKLGAYIEQSEEGVLYAFYGKVRLRLRCTEKSSKTNKEYEIYFLDIFTLNADEEWKKRASFYLGSSPLEIDEDSLYYIVFIGYPQFENGYPNIELANKKAFKYEKVQ